MPDLVAAASVSASLGINQVHGAASKSSDSVSVLAWGPGVTAMATFLDRMLRIRRDARLPGESKRRKPKNHRGACKNGTLTRHVVRSVAIEVKLLYRRKSMYR